MFAFLATLCAGLFAGGAGYVSLVEHWARLEAGAPAGLAQFRCGFPRARSLQGGLAVSGGIFGALAWLTGSGAAWLLVALLLFGSVGYTLSRIAPVCTRLLDPSLEPESPEAEELLGRWGRLHHLRAIAGALAFFVALAAR